MGFVSDLLGSQPILTLFLAIGLGYAGGQISVLGFSLGIGAVLFVGLFLGAIAPKAQIAGPIGLIGLIMFLTGSASSTGDSSSRASVAPGASTICSRWSQSSLACWWHSVWARS